MPHTAALVVPKNRDMEENQKIGIGDFIFLTITLILVVGAPFVVIKNHITATPIENYSAIASYIGYTALILLALVVLTNLNLSIIRPWRHMRKHGSFDNYQNMSGIPGIGTIFVLVAALFLPPSLIFGVILIILFLADTGGLHFALYAIISEFFHAEKNN